MILKFIKVKDFLTEEELTQEERKRCGIEIIA